MGQHIPSLSSPSTFEMKISQQIEQLTARLVTVENKTSKQHKEQQSTNTILRELIKSNQQVVQSNQQMLTFLQEKGLHTNRNNTDRSSSTHEEEEEEEANEADAHTASSSSSSSSSTQQGSKLSTPPSSFVSSES